MRKRTFIIRATAGVVGTILVTFGAAATGTVWAQDTAGGSAGNGDGVTVTITPAPGRETAESSSAPAAQTPRILPDNLTDFIKIALERIRLALAQNDAEKARLLTEFAEERLAEAFALIREGKTDLARQTLEEALKDQRLALDGTGGSQTGPDNQTQETSDGEEKNGDVGSKRPPAPDTLRGGTGSDSGTSENRADAETWKRAAHNVEALSAALQKVGSSKAQDAIERNIVQDLEHLKKKIDQ